MKQEEFITYCNDAIELNGILFIPKEAKAVIQFNCGTATKKEYYISFLTYLAENGFICCLWNYRGTKASDKLKNCDYKFSDYGIKDIPTIKAYLRNRYPDLPFFFIGHSTGGQQIGFIQDLSHVCGNINIATSAGYYPNMPIGYRLKAFFFFYIFSLLSILFYKFVNAKAFKIMENLPKTIAYEWRDWCEQENYFFDDKFYGKTVPKGHFKDFKFPIHVVYSTDDTISNRKNTKAFWKNVHSEKGITFEEINPRKLGLKKIDHFGYFRKNMKEKLWPQILHKLNEFLQ